MKKHLTLRLGLAILAVLMCTSAFFLVLYRFDNKYTQPAIQPVNGFLALSGEYLAKDPIRFLCHGWTFYPDVLLTPELYSQEASSLYMNYVSIGEYAHFDLFGRRNDPHGCGTYALQLLLPDEPLVYALSLPSVYSSYRLYVNDSLLLQVGSPDPQHYEARTQYRMATFKASGFITILLSVSDYSHYRSGLVNPPAFGTPLALNLNRGIKLGLNLSAAVITFIVILLALYAAVHRRQANGFLYAFLCFTMCFSSGSLLFHSLFELPVFPWNALELAGKYLVTLLVLILHNRICRTDRRAAVISNGAAAVFCLLTLVYGLFSARLSVPAMQLFSAASDIYKILTASYLIVTAYRALDTLDRSSSILFCASLVYAQSYLWDRFLPGYEPIYGAWFTEWGGLAMVFAAGITLWSEILRAYSNNLAFAEEHRQITRQLSMQIAYSRQINEQIRENRRLIHDFRQHLRTLTGIARENGDKEILSYLGQITQLTDSSSLNAAPSFCGSAAPDALLHYYYSLAQEKHIAMDIRFSLPDSLPLSDVELCTVLGNLLENAVEACERQVCAKPSVLLVSRQDPSAYFLLLENSYNGHIKMKNGRLLSHKSTRPRLGLGLESVRKIVELHGGTLDIYPMAQKFRIGICLPVQRQ